MNLSESESIQNLNGEVIFDGTDTGITILFNYLKAGKTINTFLEDYPKVNLQKVLDVLELAEDQLKANFLTDLFRQI